LLSGFCSICSSQNPDRHPPPSSLYFLPPRQSADPHGLDIKYLFLKEQSGDSVKAAGATHKRAAMEQEEEGLNGAPYQKTEDGQVIDVLVAKKTDQRKRNRIEKIEEGLHRLKSVQQKIPKFNSFNQLVSVWRLIFSCFSSSTPSTQPTVTKRFKPNTSGRPAQPGTKGLRVVFTAAAKICKANGAFSGQSVASPRL
jgi:hypothetical protein